MQGIINREHPLEQGVNNNEGRLFNRRIKLGAAVFVIGTASAYLAYRNYDLIISAANLSKNYVSRNIEKAMNFSTWLLNELWNNLLKSIANLCLQTLNVLR